MRPRKIATLPPIFTSNGIVSTQIVSLAVIAGRERRSKIDRLVRSQDKLRSIDVEDTAPDAKLPRSLGRQQPTANDLQDVLFSTGVPAILLDADLNIVFLTPAAEALFNATPGDLARSLTDLNWQAFDEALLNDAKTVLRTLEPAEREIQAQSGASYVRRIWPRRAEGGPIEGVVITFTDVTYLKEVESALEREKLPAEAANSRLLANASHDLRQPLQTLMLLQELLAKFVVDDKGKKLLGRFDQTIRGMAGMLSELPDLKQIEAGGARPALETFQIDAVLDHVDQDADRMPARAEEGQFRDRDSAAPGRVVYVVDDDSAVRDALRSTLEDEGHIVEDFENAEAFLAAFFPGRNACLLIDANLPGMSGVDLLKRLKETGHWVPAILITGHSDVPMAVEAMKAGATDFLEKPVRGAELLAGVGRALELSHDASKLNEWRKSAVDHLAGLTIRQHQIMELVLAGHPSKNIAADLGISQRTVENHRASIMKKAGVRSLPALARLALAAAGAVATNQALAAISGTLSV